MKFAFISDIHGNAIALDAVLDDIKNKTAHDLHIETVEIEAQMKRYAEDLDFEKAIECRDRLRRIQIELEKKNAR